MYDYGEKENGFPSDYPIETKWLERAEKSAFTSCRTHTWRNKSFRGR